MAQLQSIALRVAVCVFLALASIPRVEAAEHNKAILIIAPEKLFPPLKTYADHKRRLRPAELVSLEEALKSSRGVDDPERLKRFLYDRWREKQIGFVLLVGDVDVLPVRYMVLDRVTRAAFDYAFYPSDLYYADLARPDGSFDNWNAQAHEFHAQYFGEVRGEKNKQDPVNFDQVDYLPEIAVGRWPASTVEEVALIAEKSMRYEAGREPAPDTPKAGFVAVDGWVDCRPRMDRWASTMGERWQIQKLYYTDQPGVTGSVNPTHAQVRSLFNDKPSLVLHTGHGQPDAWEKCLHLTDLDKLTNSAAPAVVLSVGCSTAYFAPLAPYDGYVDVHGREHKGTDHGEVFTGPPPMAAPYQRGKYNPTGLGEQMLKRNLNGAVVYIGCNTGSQPCALSLAEGFLEAISNPSHMTIGECWAEAVRYYYRKENLEDLKPLEGWYPPSIFFQGMKFMFFGDPSLGKR